MRSICRTVASVLLIALIAIAGRHSAGAAAASEIVLFESATFPPTAFQKKKAKAEGREAKPLPGTTIIGHLYKPEGQGPFPAVVLLHGCGGIWKWNKVWANRLADWGYVVLSVDSFWPRHRRSVCKNGGLIPASVRAFDAFGAKSYLGRLPYIDAERIAMLGMSHGGWTVLHAANQAASDKLELKPFRAAIALYPWCDDVEQLNAPLLILIGQLDDWTPVRRCESFAAITKTPHEFTFKIYPDAHHVFDLEGVDERYDKYILRYNANASADAIARIKAFLQKHL